MSDALDNRIGAVSAVMNISQLAADVALYVCGKLDVEKSIEEDARLASPGEAHLAMYECNAPEDTDHARQELTNLALVVVARDANMRPLIK